MTDWDCVIGEAALGLDLARVDSLREGPGLALSQQARQTAVAVLNRPAAPGPDTRADAIFRTEALEFKAHGHDAPGGVVRLGARWLTWAYRATLVLLAAAIASLWVIRTTESTSGPVAVDGRTGMVALLVPAAAGPDLTGSAGLVVVLPGGRSLRVTGLHAVLAGDAAIRAAGFTPLNQPALLVTGRAGPDAALAVKAGRATVVLRSETVADVLARQFSAMLGQGTAP